MDYGFLKKKQIPVCRWWWNHLKNLRCIEESGLPRLFWEQEIAGSNPAAPTKSKQMLYQIYKYIMEYICKFCGKLCKNANSLRNHERLCKLNPEHQVSSWVKFNKEREHAWNKGLTKEMDERVKKQAETFSSNIKKGITKQYDHSLIWTEERRKEQSERKKK